MAIIHSQVRLAPKEIIIYPFSINKNVLVSTTIFGKIPKDLTDLCLDLLIKK